jgi:hypothetical protein
MFMAQCNRHTTFIDTSITGSFYYLYDSGKETPHLSIQTLLTFQNILPHIKPSSTTLLAAGHIFCVDTTALSLAIELGIVEFIEYFESTQESISTVQPAQFDSHYFIMHLDSHSYMVSAEPFQ